MSSLEQRLQQLGRELAFPPEPELDVAARAAGRPFPWRWAALAAAVVALAAAAAVPQARTSILRFFHLRGATIERVETLPAAQERSKAGGLGERFDTRRGTAAGRLPAPPAAAPGRRRRCTCSTACSPR